MILLFLIGLGTVNVKAQVAIGANTVPHPGAVLDLKSTNQGLLLPRVALSDVAVFGLSGTASTAVGMTVYNTNAGIVNGKGVGIYVWDGNIWKVAGNSGGVGEVGVLDTIRGANGTYRFWCYPASSGVGCWMVDNSLEGTRFATNYNNNPIFPTGGYYTWANAQNSCPTGWRLPTSPEWATLAEYINGPSSTVADKTWWSIPPTMNGYWNVNTSSWTGLASDGIYWSSTTPLGHAHVVNGTILPNFVSAVGYHGVRCVKFI